MSIVVENLSKAFSSFKAVENVGFEIQTGQLVAILGPSGSGKSTILRLIAGLEIADSGKIFLSGKEMTNVPVRERNVGFVSQHYSLFRHMTVKENVSFGLKVRHKSTVEIDKKVTELLGLVNLNGLENRLPYQLSGGQRQRVALARALAPQPKVLLLDEPFGALDAQIREELRHWIRKLHEITHVTTIFVTHDQQEAIDVAGKIIILNKGKIIQEGIPSEIYNRPNSSFVAEFIGQSNTFETIVPEDKIFQLGSKKIPLTECLPGKNMKIYIRFHEIKVSDKKEDGSFPAMVSEIRFKGQFLELVLRLEDGKILMAHLAGNNSQKFSINQTVNARIEKFLTFCS